VKYPTLLGSDDSATWQLFYRSRNNKAIISLMIIALHRLPFWNIRLVTIYSYLDSKWYGQSPEVEKLLTVESCRMRFTIPA
jgi:hypothetical protein